MSETFLQSVEWEDFQKSAGRRVWRADGSLVIRHDLPGGLNYLYCPRPRRVTDGFFAAAESIAREEGSIFLKVDPLEKLPITDYQLPIKGSVNLQPRKSVTIDLTKSEDDLLRSMHGKTRYNIRLAERHGVTVAPSGELTTTDALIWWSLVSATARRDGFYTHEKSYYEKLLRIRSGRFSNELFLADCNMTALAGAIVNFYRPTLVATYLHGASLRENKEIMAPHLLHWRIMQEARRRGFMFYDLWGIDEKKWPGVTRFKLSLGGKVTEYPESADIVYRPAVYFLYRLARKLGHVIKR